jgi:hypothetical protein
VDIRIVGPTGAEPVAEGGTACSKRIGVVLAAALLGVAAVAGPATAQPEPRFTLQIDPSEGPVGTVIHAQLPEEATAVGGECLSPSEIFASLQDIAGEVIAQGSPEPGVKNLLQSIQNAQNVQDLGPNAIDLSLFFVLAFADPVTQRPAIDQTTGQESATSFWDPATGKGTSLPRAPSVPAPTSSPGSASTSTPTPTRRLWPPRSSRPSAATPPARTRFRRPRLRS